MNERIRELAEQAEISRLEYNPDTMMTERIQEFDKEKFAQLIVLECASIVYKTCRDGDAGAQAILYEFDIDNARSQK